LRGGRGGDTLLSGADGALTIGGAGSDGFNMEDGRQVGGGGPDEIHARDGTEDQINCGDGDDIAYVDGSEEGVYDCERVVSPKGGGK